MTTNVVTVLPVNELNEVVLQNGVGSSNIVSYIPATNAVADLATNKLVMKLPPEVTLLSRDSTTNEIGLAGAATNSGVEEVYRKAISQIGVKTLPTIVETIPTANAVAKYYIDPISGNDSNTGTSPSTAWATLKKLMLLNPGAGAVINLAADGVFEYAENMVAYRARSTFPYNGCDSIRGTASQPVVIKPYSARNSASQKKPIIRWFGVVADGDWIQETSIGKNIWSTTYAGTLSTDNTSFVMFGPNKILGQAPRNQVTGSPYGNNPQQLAVNRDYCFNSSKLYVYCDMGTPTSSFGGVYLAGAPIFCTAWEGLNQTKFTNLRFEYCTAVQIVHGSATLNGVQGFEVTGCEFFRANIGYFNSLGTNASASEMTVTFKDNVFTEVPAAAIRLGNCSGGTSGNSIGWEVSRNRVYGGCMTTVSGALLYNQSVGGASKHIAWGNYGYDCRNGTGGASVDGSFIYHDLSSKNSITYGNIAEKCSVPYQVNNALAASVISNLAIDCHNLALFTASADGNAPNQSQLAAHNTWLWTGRIDPTSIPKSTSSPSFAGGAVITQYNDNFGAFGNKITNFVAVNNLAVSASTQTASKPFLSYISSQITTTLITGNATLGLGSILARDNAIDTTTSVNFSLTSALSDLSTWIPDAVSGKARPAKDSSIAGIGTSLSIQYQDISGKNFSTRPTPGCYEPQA